MRVAVLLSLIFLSCHAEISDVYELRECSTDDCVSEVSTIEKWLSPWVAGEPQATRFSAHVRDDQLHFMWEVTDTLLQISGLEDEEQAAVRSDRVEIFWAVDTAATVYYSLEMDAAGRLWDSKCAMGAGTEGRPLIDHRWDWPGGLDWYAETSADGYRVCGQMDMAVLRELDLWDEGEMIVGLYRADYHASGTEWISWIDPGTAKPDFHRASSFGKWVVK